MVSTTGLSAALDQETAEAFLYLLTIVTDDETFRFVNNTKAVTSSSVEYEAFPFEVTPPQETDEVPVAKLRIANVTREIAERVQAMSDRPTVTFSTVLADSPDTVEESYTGFAIESVRWDAGLFEASLTQARFTSEPYPKLRITPDNYRSLFL